MQSLNSSFVTILVEISALEQAFPGMKVYTATDPEINQRRWLAYVGFKLGRSYIISISYHKSSLMGEFDRVLA